MSRPSPSVPSRIIGQSLPINALPAVALLVVAALMLPVAGAGAGSVPAHAPAEVTARNPGSAVPVASVPLPSALDNASFYEAQRTCDPVTRPGTAAVANLLRATYGPATIYTTRRCTSNTSEHFDGRALDWMRSVRLPAEREMAEAFLTWLLAPAPDGTPHAMARRLGVMYLIWNNRMIRTYDPERGWTNYRGCLASSKASAALDTSCHRNHVHISLSWDGAAGLTSWWTGSVLTQPYCPTSRTKAKPRTAVGPGLVGVKVISDLRAAGVTPMHATAVLDTLAGSGAGLSGPCRLVAGRTLYPKVRVPGLVPKSATAVAVKMSALSNAPAALATWSSGSARPIGQLNLPMTAPMSTGIPVPPSATVLVPVASDGTIAVATTVGSVFVGMSVVGFVGGAAEATPEPSRPATPATAPVKRPTRARSIQASVAGGTVTTGWRPPSSDGGDPHLGYRVEALDSPSKGAAVAGRCTADAAARKCQIAKLQPGRRYWMSVSVGNSAGRTWSPRREVWVP